MSQPLQGFNGIIPIDYLQLNKIFPFILDIGTINLTLPFMTAIGHTTRDELTFVCGIVKWAQPEKIFEIGTFDGLSSVNMIKHAPEDCTIYTLDIPEEEIGNSTFPIDSINASMVRNPRRQEHFKNSQYKDQIIPLYGDSAKFDCRIARDTACCAFPDSRY